MRLKTSPVGQALSGEANQSEADNVVSVGSISRRRALTFFGVALGSAAVSPLANADRAKCGFPGPVQAQWDDPSGRLMTLLAPFSYTDSSGKLWGPVPKGWKVDGASIPQAAWSFIGGPFEGAYREASVIHDYYCDIRTQTWQATHLVFYDGMICNKVDKAKADIMYAAVYLFGPRWRRAIGPHTPNSNYGTQLIIPLYKTDNFSDLKTWIETSNPTPEQIASKISALEIGSKNIQPER